MPHIVSSEFGDIGFLLMFTMFNALQTQIQSIAKNQLRRLVTILVC